MPPVTRMREVVLIVIGVITPVGILAVNGAAFVMQHLVQFRVFLAGAALLSSLLLNGLVAITALREAKRTAPLLYEEYKRVVWVAAVLAVVLFSYLAAYFTNLGLQDARQLPSIWGVLGSVLALATPFVFTYVDRRFLRRREAHAEKEERKEQAAERQAMRNRASHRRA